MFPYWNSFISSQWLINRSTRGFKIVETPKSVNSSWNCWCQKGMKTQTTDIYLPCQMPLESYALSINPLVVVSPLLRKLCQIKWTNYKKNTSLRIQVNRCKCNPHPLEEVDCKIEKVSGGKCSITKVLSTKKKVVSMQGKGFLSLWDSTNPWIFVVSPERKRISWICLLNRCQWMKSLFFSFFSWTWRLLQKF